MIRLGGSAADEVTAKTTLVVVGAEGGANAEKSQKQRKAEDLGVRVISENDFCRMAGIQPPEDLKQQYYGQRDLLSMYPGLREDHLRYLQKWGLIRPVMRTHTETYYPFSDLLLIRQVSAELESAPFRAILRSLQAERSGQLTFDFRIDAEPARIIKLKRPKPREIGKEPGKDTVVPMTSPQTLAEEYFMKASALDVDESRHNAAATWYRKALEIDPYLVPALINLANIHYGKDELAEAQALYERAIGLDPDFFEAHFNLGQHLSRPRPLQGSGELLSHGAAPERAVRRRALLSGDYAGKDGALSRSEAALARVSVALAERRMGGAGAGSFRNRVLARLADRSEIGGLQTADSRNCRLPISTADYQYPKSSTVRFFGTRRTL